MPTTLEIPLNKSKILLLILLSLLIGVGGMWFVFGQYSFQLTLFGFSINMKILGSIVAIFFGACTILLFKKYQDKKPGLIIDTGGLTDNSSAVSAGFIPWDDIESIHMLTLNRQDFIQIKVSNPQDYIDQQKSSFKRKLMQLNQSTYGSPINITANTLKISSEELFAIIKEHLEQQK
ncbi:MAG: hypothetical protein JNJ58_00440 [Chitinophagaceae bacterium]|nr:hypothetical protein [Chitinophagaceae bacterium]